MSKQRKITTFKQPQMTSNIDVDLTSQYSPKENVDTKSKYDVLSPSHYDA